jgi:hypothetical protein
MGSDRRCLSRCKDASGAQRVGASGSEAAQ